MNSFYFITASDLSIVSRSIQGRGLHKLVTDDLRRYEKHQIYIRVFPSEYHKNILYLGFGNISGP